MRGNRSRLGTVITSDFFLRRISSSHLGIWKLVRISVSGNPISQDLVKWRTFYQTATIFRQQSFCRRLRSLATQMSIRRRFFDGGHNQKVDRTHLWFQSETVLIP